MFYLSPEGKRHYLNRAFDYNDRQYTRFAATHEKFTELGFTQVIVGPRPDDRFYIVSGPDDTGAYTSTPRDLNDLKVRFIEEDKQTARQLLSNTDWYIIRLLETQTPAPAAVGTDRADIRAAQNVREDEINYATTVEELKQLIDSDLTPFPSDDVQPDAGS
jgi:hypothetical protein